MLHLVLDKVLITYNYHLNIRIFKILMQVKITLIINYTIKQSHSDLCMSISVNFFESLLFGNSSHQIELLIRFQAH